MVQQIAPGRAFMMMLRGISIALFTMTGAATTLAGPIEDCNQGMDPERRIRGCTAFIQGEVKLKGELTAADTATAYLNRGIVWSDKADSDRAMADYDQAK